METLQPKLRFPEFNGKYKNKRVDDFAPLQRGFDLPITKMVKGKFPVVFSNGISKTHNEFKVKAPGIVTGRSGTIGNLFYIEEDFWPHNTSLWVTDFKGNFPKYVYYFYDKFDLKRFGTGSGVPTLNRNDVHNQQIYFPSLEEQTKIAIFLSSVDEKLSLLKEKKSLLEEYKKGIMQKLFSKVLRFKDGNGNDFEDWEVKSIGDILSIGSGRDYKHLNLGNVPVYGTGGLMTYVDSFLHQGETVCIGRKGTIDKPMYFNGDIWTVDTLFYTHTFIDSLPKYVFYVFQSINWKKHNEASGVPSLSKSTIEKISINVPSVPEQTKIADFLSVIDEKIELVSTQIEEIQEYKKGLLQLMFV
ncbi:restriction endonuclease subunit S [Flavobacterium sp. ALJ2]|uniref:restriction endonuclease subunit S n=1 Tax=Flavobacterium sp. ALJ2 TaxID=2786960 RepID=UPI00189FA05B|nr:restriction endonuclease subunit S [Flavobacterium sp. ALJ2]MBF7092571.1 restriction endonuclease subunit S [Flavobacterium sp. ALJ2]